ncbi:MAG: hypothetical protein U0531_21315 [Dehalococcoidia bacterium]
MFTCVICRFAAELDDVVAPTATGRCVCLRCFARETDTAMSMPKNLRRALSAALAEVEVA